jgi:hypothetical protein
MYKGRAIVETKNWGNICGTDRLFVGVFLLAWWGAAVKGG